MLNAAGLSREEKGREREDRGKGRGKSEGREEELKQSERFSFSYFSSLILPSFFPLL
jgi:hypothetical protein